MKAIPLVKVGLPDQELLMPELASTLYGGIIAEGEEVYKFESLFANRFGLKNALAFSSGTAALHASLTLSGVGLGDEVISTPMTAEPTNLSILHCGAKVVWADVDQNNGNLDPDSVEQCINSKTKAIIVVHYAGYPANLREIREISDRYGLMLIEDCAHALGAKYNGNGVGNVGDFSIFSFQAIKHLTTVDGGMLIVKDCNLIEAAKKFRWFGMLKGVSRTEVDINRVGYKYNMNNVAATIGLAQLNNIDNRLAKFISNGQYYDTCLREISGVSFAQCDRYSEPSYWLYTLLSDDSESIRTKLESLGVQASKLHRPNNRHTIFNESSRKLPNLDLFYRRLLHIPSGWWITNEDREMIVNAIKGG